jgi:hypothetical protein
MTRYNIFRGPDFGNFAKRVHEVFFLGWDIEGEGAHGGRGGKEQNIEHGSWLRFGNEIL